MNQNIWSIPEQLKLQRTEERSSEEIRPLTLFTDGKSSDECEMMVLSYKTTSGIENSRGNHLLLGKDENQVIERGLKRKERVEVKTSSSKEDDALDLEQSNGRSTTVRCQDKKQKVKKENIELRVATSIADGSPHDSINKDVEGNTGINKTSKIGTSIANPSHTRRKFSSCSTSSVRTSRKVLRMTSLLIVVFMVCWTPYVFVTIWHSFVPPQETMDSMRKILFFFAVSNSCINPYLYGNLFRFLRERKKRRPSHT